MDRRRGLSAFTTGMGLAGSLLLFAINHAAAAPHSVVPGEFIVSLSKRSLNGHQILASTDLTAEGITTSGNLGNDTLVVTPRYFPQGLNRSAVDYKAADDICPPLLKRNVVAACSPNWILRASEDSAGTPGAEQYGLGSTGMNAVRAWEKTTGSAEVVVAIVDTGVDYHHPDLAPNIWRNDREVEGNGVDDDGNGVIDDLHGYNAAADSGNPRDDNGHGSHVAGTIGAAMNGTGVVGVAWHVKLLPVKFLGSNGSGSLSDAIKGINYLVNLKNRGVNIRIMNNSWGGGAYSAPLEEAIARARDAGIIFVAAAGNESNNNDFSPAYPASYALDNIVSVAAVDGNFNLAGFSNYGLEVDIAAPGVGILSTSLNGGFATLSGTSMASPHVAGALALLFSQEPWLSAGEALQRLYESGSPQSTVTGLVRTGRVLDAGRMVYGETAPVPQPSAPGDVCTYTVTEQASAPIDAAQGEVVYRGDEGIMGVSLPFDFPFFGSSSRTIYLSTNGVIYPTSPPGAFDFQHGQFAPQNSIAVLHADLIGESEPFGIRLESSAESVTIVWYMRHYALPTSGEVVARATLYPSGRIETGLGFSSALAASVVGGASMIGISGTSRNSSITYAFDDAAKIRDGLGLVFEPQCNGNGTAAVRAITIRPKKGKTLHAGKRFVLKLSGDGSGTVPLQASIDGRACAESTMVELRGGIRTLQGTIPFAAARAVSFSSGGAKRSGKLRGKGILRKQSKERVERACEILMRTLRVE